MSEASKETAVDLLRSIDATLKKLLEQSEEHARQGRESARYVSPRAPRGGQIPCKACEMKESCKSACSAKHEWMRDNPAAIIAAPYKERAKR